MSKGSEGSSPINRLALYIWPAPPGSMPSLYFQVERKSLTDIWGNRQKDGCRQQQTTWSNTRLEYDNDASATDDDDDDAAKKMCKTVEA